jgi:hypothetical protein
MLPANTHRRLERPGNVIPWPFPGSPSNLPPGTKPQPIDHEKVWKERT